MAEYNPDRPRRSAPSHVPGSPTDAPTAGASPTNAPTADAPAAGASPTNAPPTNAPSTNAQGSGKTGNGMSNNTSSEKALLRNGDPTPAPVTRVLPRHGLPDRILLVAGTITATVGLVALVAAVLWWRRHRITIRRVGNQVTSQITDQVAGQITDQVAGQVADQIIDAAEDSAS